MQPQVIDFENRQFKANGKKFLIEVENLPTGRYQKFEQMGISFAFGSTFGDIFQSFQKIYQAATSGNDILKAVNVAQEVSYNQMHAIKRNDENYKPHILWFCTIFCNYEDEDRTTWSEDVARQKIADWERSSVPIQDFFFVGEQCTKRISERIQLSAITPSKEASEKVKPAWTFREGKAINNEQLSKQNWTDSYIFINQHLGLTFSELRSIDIVDFRLILQRAEEIHKQKTKNLEKK